MTAPAAFLPPREFIRSGQAAGRAWPAAECRAYTRWLATTHYENFHVATLLLPRRLHQDFFNVYAFCRWADDLGDEMGSPAESLRLLAWWRGELDAMFLGEATHPVFVALRETVASHGLPPGPFQDLIRAFVQDQEVCRYATWDELAAYCSWSANPVGRLVLRLCGYADDERERLSDATCTALQLANFWQDVAADLEKGRIYLPLELLSKHNCPEADVLGRRATRAFRSALEEAVEVARRYFHQGLPLARLVHRRLAVDIELFSRGGLLVLDKIARQEYDVFSARPVISRSERAWLLLATLARAAFPKAAG
ncbi:MAG: squalene synthase HpnC [Bryobacterales bacterium]|nr:squalene synthase HpnC [Bryobacterales bacterium]